MGYIYEGKPEATLVDMMLARVNDPATGIPEGDIVKLQCIIALGRMKAKKAIPDISKVYYEGKSSRFMTVAAHFTLPMLTGEKLPKLPRPVIYHTGWFLEPIPQAVDDNAKK